MEKLEEKIKAIPTKPGVYLFKNASGGVLYVGKAKNLHSRVAQYFTHHDKRPQLPYLLEEAADLDYTVTASELESIFLENTLIKQYLPPYNIKLRDDKNYAFIKIDYASQIPQISYARKVERDAHTATYFGPYSSTKKIKDTLELVRKIFPYCAHTKVGDRPCFYFHLHRCPGVCVGKISLPEYQEQLRRITLFLSGRTYSITHELSAAMKKSAAEKQFEQAARLRDQLRALSVLHERQAVIFPARVSWDFIGIVTEASIACVNLFKIREGKLIDKEQFIYEGMVTETLVLQTFLENYYADSSDLPKEIYVPEMPQDSSVVMRLLRVRSNRSITMTVPTRGKKLGLLRLATTNAKEALYTFRRSLASDRDIVAQALAKLQSILGLEELPHRIEGYDISNTQGTNPVGSMVVFSQGLPAKAEYRKFKITGKQTPDDFSMMREMLSRRLQRLAPTQGAWPTPNLLVIDGGKGQLSVATAVLKEKKLRIPVIGLAKRIEEIFVPGKKQPILLAHSDPALQLLQRLRDEAHRFAITFHRSIRSKQAVISALDKVPGVGAKTKKLLKQKFGTVAQIRQTDEATLASVVGTDKAKKLKKYL